MSKLATVTSYELHAPSHYWYQLKGERLLQSILSTLHCKPSCCKALGLIFHYSPCDSLRQVRVIIVTKGEFLDQLERTLCNVFSFKCMEIGRTTYALHCAVSLYRIQSIIELLLGCFSQLSYYN